MTFKYLDVRCVYSVNIDNEIMGFVQDEETAIEMVEKISNILIEVLKEEKPGKHFYQERCIDADKCINIYGMRPGNLWNGSVKHLHVVKYSEIKKMMHIPDEPEERSDEGNAEEQRGEGNAEEQCDEGNAEEQCDEGNAEEQRGEGEPDEMSGEENVDNLGGEEIKQYGEDLENVRNGHVYMEFASMENDDESGWTTDEESTETETSSDESSPDETSFVESSDYPSDEEYSSDDSFNDEVITVRSKLPFIFPPQPKILKYMLDDSE